MDFQPPSSEFPDFQTMNSELTNSQPLNGSRVIDCEPMPTDFNDSQPLDSEPISFEFTESQPVDSQPSDSAGYSGGRILRLKMINFMTYDNMEIIPGPGLNLIVGPNGSGKSTTVCAICLVLGGKPTFTGRKMQLVDFVKHGKTQASIEIELDDPCDSRNLVIKRQIHANGSFQYFIHGRISKESAIAREVSRFNIQVDNLCQFLPQERVSEFAKMNSIQLLESMQNAVGDQNLFKMHDDLKKLTDQSRDLVGQIRNKQDFVSSEKKKNLRLETEVQIYEEILQYNNQKKLLNEKLAVLTYKDAYKKMEEQKKKGADLQAEAKKLEATTLNPLHAKLQAAEIDIRETAEKNKKQHNLYDSKKKLINETSGKLTAIDDMIYESRVSLEHKVKEQGRQQDRIKVIETQLQSYQKDLEDQLEQKKTLEATMKSVENESSSIINEIHTKEVALEDIGFSMKSINQQQQVYKRQLQELDGIEQRKLQVLKKVDESTFKALLWLRENRHKFKKRVFEPILMLIEIPDDRNVKFVENHISFRDLIAFMCEDKSDSEILIGKLRKEMGLAINTVLALPHHPSEYKPNIPLSELQRTYHLKAYMKDLFKAPDPIVTFLCNNYNIHNTPIGDENTEDHLEFLLNSAKFGRFYTPDSCYTIKRSLYGRREVSIINSDLKPPSILSSFSRSSDQQLEVEQKIKDLDEQYRKEKEEQKKLVSDIQELNKRLEELRRKKKAFKDLTTSIKNIKLLIDQKDKSIQIIKKSSFNINEEKQKAAKFVKAKYHEKVILIGNIKKLLKECGDIAKQRIQLQLISQAFWKKKNILLTKIREKDEFCKNLKSQITDAQRVYEELKQEAKKRLKEASVICNMDIKKQSEPVLKKKYGHLPNTIDDVNSEVHKLTAKINCLGESNKSAFDEHQRRKRDILAVEHSLDEIQSRLTIVKTEIETKKQLWLKPLEQLIRRISHTFSEYFEVMGCAGEILLKTGEDPDDFYKYGLSILVKFRGADPLMELSHSHHSGGECSVSTIIFILSLQKLTIVPFRCVDEINQGMDAVNERRIFDLVSRSAENYSQYFLLTPKLLPMLTYPQEVRVHVIYNAPAVQEGMNWKIDTILRNLAAAKARNSIRASP